ncbi:MAG: hypothetical protein Ta2E_01430 [Mycoplasmoidaceae bacterium]|nr:MAG: hypothetical protein Ta2E_01430 [Mycoplasmoidaceae bacterium]
MPMKYCKTDDDMSVIKITDVNCKRMDDITKPYGKMKDSFDIIRSLLENTFANNGRLKSFLQGTSYGQILFHVKGNINESLIELDTNSL